MVDRWAVMDHDLDARDRELWAPMHRKSKALRAALRADAFDLLTDEGRAAAQVDPGGKHDAWLEARPHD